MLLEFERRLHEWANLVVKKAGGWIEVCEFLLVGFIEAGCVIPRIGVAGAAIHERPDRRFGARGEVRCAWRQRVELKLCVICKSLFAQVGVEGEHADAAAG